MVIVLALAAGFIPPVASPATAQAAPGGAAAAVEETLDSVHDLLVQLDARIKDIRMRAEEILVLADAATDSGEQTRLEELYGEMEALAQRFEEERSKLRTLYEELVGGADRAEP